jgi:hypothetical protein
MCRRVSTVLLRNPLKSFGPIKPPQGRFETGRDPAMEKNSLEDVRWTSDSRAADSLFAIAL